MRCFHPITIDLSDTDARQYYQEICGSPIIRVPCGKCIACLKQKRNEWVFRLNARQEIAKTAYFITLTYSDENLRYGEIGGIPTLLKDDLKKFLHNLKNEANYICRKMIAKEQGIPVRQVKCRTFVDYFAVGEYGDDFDRPHYHLVLFDFLGDIQTLSDAINKHWKYQDIIPDIRYCSGRLINYITKYMIKDEKIDYEKEKIQPPFRLMSKGIGKNYVTRARTRQHVISDDYTSNIGNARYGLPRYLKKKIQQSYYSEYHAIPKSDSDFYYTLGATAYKEAQERAKIEQVRQAKIGFSPRNLVDYERALKRKERNIIEMKTLNKKRK